MNTVAEKPVTTLTLPQRAAVALGTAEHEIKLRALVASSADIVAVIDPAGREQAHRIGMNLKTARVNIEKAGKIAREDATAFSKAIIAEEKRLVAIAEPEESRVIGLRDEWDAKIEAEKQARIAAERMRMEKIAQCIDAIRDLPIACAGATAAGIASLIETLRANEVTEFLFAERLNDATELKQSTMERLTEMHAAQMEAEAAALAAEQARIAEAARIEAERAELAELRAAAAKVAAEQAAEAKRLADLAAAQESEAKRQRDQAAAEQAERERVAVEAQAKANAELKATQDKLNAEQAEFRAQQQAAQAAAILAQEIEIHHGQALVMNAEWDVAELERVGRAQIDAAHGEALEMNAVRNGMEALRSGDNDKMRAEFAAAGFDVVSIETSAETPADQFFRCTATAAECLAGNRTGIDALTDAADEQFTDDEIIAELLAALILCAEQLDMIAGEDSGVGAALFATFKAINHAKGRAA